MVDDKEVDLKEDKIQKAKEGLSRTQNHAYSSCNNTSPEWTNTTNTYKGNSTNSNNIVNKEPYLELQKNLGGGNHTKVQELTGGKIANYNRSSGMIDDLPMGPDHVGLSSNQINATGHKSNSTRIHLDKQLKGIFCIEMSIYLFFGIRYLLLYKNKQCKKPSLFT